MMSEGHFLQHWGKKELLSHQQLDPFTKEAANNGSTKQIRLAFSYLPENIYMIPMLLH